VYNGATGAALTTASYSVSGLVGTDSVTVNQTAGAYNTKSVTATTVSASLTPANLTPAAGTLASNYVPPATASGAGVITPLSLTVTAVTNTKAFDGTTSAAAIPAVTSGAVQPGDT